MMITKSILDNAMALLSKEPDNSKANKQARQHSVNVVKAHISNLEEFLAKSKESRLATSLVKQIAELKAII